MSVTYPNALQMASEFIAQLEGFRSAPYQDSAGVWTIGNGTIRIDGVPVSEDTPPINQDRATELLMVELVPTAASIDNAIPSDATDGQRAACYSFAYNEGVHAFLTSTLLREWRQGLDQDEIGVQFIRWNVAGGHPVAGLTNRRRKEFHLYCGGTVSEALAA